MLSSDDAAPVDRPNLSKDYLAGNAPEDWVPLRPDSFYSDNGIDLRLSATVAGIDVGVARGRARRRRAKSPYDRLLLATGAEPVRLSIPGAAVRTSHVLRSLGDCRAIIERAKTARRAVVLGASFIGLEVAASLRAREHRSPCGGAGKAADGAHSGAADGRLHARAARGARRRVPSRGHGERSRRQKGEAQGRQHRSRPISWSQASACARESSLPRGPASSRSRRRRECLSRNERAGNLRRRRHRALARRRIAARPSASNIGWWPSARGRPRRSTCSASARNSTAVPFFWSQHYDVPINYVGHAETWDELAVEGDIAGKDCLVRYKRAGRTLAVASIYRDVASLEAEVAFERAATR